MRIKRHLVVRPKICNDSVSKLLRFWKMDYSSRSTMLHLAAEKFYGTSKAIESLLRSLQTFDERCIPGQQFDISGSRTDLTHEIRGSIPEA